MTSSPALDIQHLETGASKGPDPLQGRFQAVVEGLPCVIDYHLSPGCMHITHTGVPRALEGRGIAAALVQHALSWARARQLKVHPACSYVAAYLRRHPGWQDLL